MGQPSEARIERIENGLLRADTHVTRRQIVSEMLPEHGLTPLAGGAAPFDARRYALGPQETWLGGFIPGRHPVLRSELVVARVAIDDSNAGILMEAAHVLVERSRTENVPGRSVLIALYSDSTRSVARSLWPASSIHARIDLGRDANGGAQYTVAWTGRDTSAVYAAEESGEAVGQVNQLLRLLLGLASPSDTLGYAWHGQPQHELE